MKRAMILFVALLLAASLATTHAEGIEGAEVGETVALGTYEQGSGPAPIEWVVLDKLDGRALLLSKYAIDCQPFHESEDWNVTWENCSLRSWLNSDFLSGAFNDEERAQILSGTNSSDAGEGDSVFLLSADEANAYLPTEESRIAEATEYAVTCGGRVSRTTGTTYWWLRTKGASDDCVLLVKYDGSIDEFGDSMEADIYTVRPAMWVRISE